MDNTSKNKWQVRIAAAIIFILGFTAGILTLNVYRGWGRGGGPSGNGFERMADRLQLNADQKTKVQQIFSDTREQLRALRKESEPRVDEIRKQADERLQQVLTPDQWQRFHEMREEMRERRERGPRDPAR